ncbi:hypothetical protein WISP_03984 [Willisornis vidua]|uniref:Uncharacterized protein n=1 Tax=Willisornis vidua TaxID=1566151 RepID=A0ABQ9DY58_9PASS|nr:hypothetical protein WISP_03984 [Willisornis vidua]
MPNKHEPELLGEKGVGGPVAIEAAGSVDAHPTVWLDMCHEVQILGIPLHRGKSSSSNWPQRHNSPKQSKTFHCCCPKLIPWVFAPGMQDLLLTPWPYPSMVLPLRKEDKVLMDDPMLPSQHILSLYLLEDLPQQPPDAKGLAGKT